MLHVRVVELAGREARVEHRMGFCHVGAPGDEHVGVVEVGIAAGGLVGLEHVHKADDGARHAQARVRIDVVGEQARLPELSRDVSLGDGLLARSPKREARLVVLPRFLELRRHEVEGFVPTRLAQAILGAFRRSIVADKRGGQPVFAVEHFREIVALDAVEPLVRLVVGVARHRDEATLIVNFADNAAPASAEAADRTVFLRFASGLRGCPLARASREHGERPACRRRCEGDRSRLHEHSS